MLKVALCDDHRDSTDQYAQMLLACAQKHQMEVELSTFESGEVLLFHFCENPNQADIIYMDILMNKIDGMETARRLRELGYHGQIVFLTSCEDYVYQAFDVNAVHYLLKAEVNLGRFETVFLKAVSCVTKKQDELFVCEFDGVKNAVPVSEISYFEIWRRLVTVYYNKDQTAKFYGTMEQLENRFADKSFIRVHRSYVVHLPYISQLLPQALLLKTGATIPVGGTYAQGLKSAFSDYISQAHVYRSFHPSTQEGKR